MRGCRKCGKKGHSAGDCTGSQPSAPPPPPSSSTGHITPPPQTSSALPSGPSSRSANAVSTPKSPRKRRAAITSPSNVVDDSSMEINSSPHPPVAAHANRFAALAEEDLEDEPVVAPHSSRGAPVVDSTSANQPSPLPAPTELGLTPSPGTAAESSEGTVRAFFRAASFASPENTAAASSSAGRQ